MQQQNNTKRVNHSSTFTRAAEADKVGSLAYMLMAAFGVSLDELCTIARAAITQADENLVAMALTAAVQIRGNVVHVGSEFGNFKRLYPVLIIEGDRAQQDIFNFSAIHCLGHVLCHIATHPLAGKILKKAGSAITGQYVTASAAGRINKEIADAWTDDDKESFRMLLVDMQGNGTMFINDCLAAASGHAAAFRQSMLALGTANFQPGTTAASGLVVAQPTAQTSSSIAAPSTTNVVTAQTAPPPTTGRKPPVAQQTQPPP